MRITQKQTVIGVVLIAILAYGSGYSTAKMGIKEVQQRLESTLLDNQVMEKQIRGMRDQAEAMGKELSALKKNTGVALVPPPYVLDAIKQRGISPEKLLEDLKEHAAMIPEAAVLGGTMHFTQTGIINERWVYGAYEDGHIAGAAVFQWEVRDSRIEWTPILVLKD